MKANDKIITSNAGLRIFEKVINDRTDQDFGDAVKKMGVYVSTGKISREEEGNLESLIVRQYLLHIKANEGVRKRRKRRDLSTELAKGYTSWYELAQGTEDMGEHTQVMKKTKGWVEDFDEVEVFNYETDYIKARAFDELSAYLPTNQDEAREIDYRYRRLQAESFGNYFPKEEKESIFSHIASLFYPKDKRKHIK